jgi:hypothetical protein
MWNIENQHGSKTRFSTIVNLVTQFFVASVSQYEVSLLLGDTAGQLEVLERAGQSAVATLLRSTLADTGKPDRISGKILIQEGQMNADPYPDSRSFFS